MAIARRGTRVIARRDVTSRCYPEGMDENPYQAPERFQATRRSVSRLRKIRWTWVWLVAGIAAIALFHPSFGGPREIEFGPHADRVYWLLGYGGLAGFFLSLAAARLWFR